MLILKFLYLNFRIKIRLVHEIQSSVAERLKISRRCTTILSHTKKNLASLFCVPSVKSDLLYSQVIDIFGLTDFPFTSVVDNYKKLKAEKTVHNLKGPENSFVLDIPNVDKKLNPHKILGCIKVMIITKVGHG